MMVTFVDKPTIFQIIHILVEETNRVQNLYLRIHTKVARLL